jgi:hypothetical protein
MKFRKIELEDTYYQSPYLLILYPTWSLEKVKIYHARRGIHKFYNFCEYVDGTFLQPLFKRRNNFDIYTLIPFHEERMLNKLLRHITGDPTFRCDVLDHKDFITMRF